MTQNANKIVRIVFEIPLSSMSRIMNNSVNDFEVVNRIIESVAIYVMNMFRREQFSSQEQFHNKSVHEHGATNIGDANFSISPSIMNPVFNIVNNDIIFNFGLRIVGDVNIHDLPSFKNEIIYVNFGDVEAHTSFVMDAASAIADREGLKGDDRAVLLLSALGHDFAKPETTVHREGKGWTSYNHEQKGGPLARRFLESIGIKPEIVNQVVVLVENHLKHIGLGANPSDKAIHNLANRLHMNKATIKQLVHLMEADASGRPDIKNNPDINVYESTKNRKMLSDEEMGKINNFYEQAKKRGVHEGPLKPFLGGKDIIAIDTTVMPGKEFGHILDRIYSLQIEGKIKTREDALRFLTELLSKRKRYKPE